MRQDILFLLATLALSSPAQAQQAGQPITSTDYARAERYLAPGTGPLVYGANVRPTWLVDDRLWYRNAIPEGFEYVLVDPVKRTRVRAFDQSKLAAALSTAAADTTYEAFHLPFSQFDLQQAGQSIQFDVGARSFTCDVAGTRCTADRRKPPVASRNSVLSPDGSRVAFIRNFNLWVREVGSGKETQLTTDGIKDDGYATDNAGWTKSDSPILLWSPDSRKIATFQQDERNVGEMYLVNTQLGHPKLEQWKYPLPGDSVIQMITRLIIDVDNAKVIKLQIPPDAHRSTLCDHVACRGGEWADVEWSADASQLIFVSTSRDHKNEKFRVADAATGAVREVFQETVKTQYESGEGRANWHAMTGTNEVIWPSERDNWAHLYLYDLRSGQVKNLITPGDGAVLQMLHVDEKSRMVYFTASGREAGRDPYFRHFYRASFDGKTVALLTPEDADHEVTLSPDGKYFVDSYSRPDVPQTTVLRDADGKLISNLEKADITRLLATGWTPPTPITVKARDGKTDLYGLMYRPTNFDPSRKYPIVNNIYPGPQTGSVGSRIFSPARGDARALAELGFVVIQLDGMGTNMRSKSFHDAYYADMGDNTLPDQIAGMKQLAQKYPWIDLERAGIYGHSGGGYATADAMFRYPDFFKVGISEAGNHDNRLYEDDWGERYQGLLTHGPNGTTNYDDQANQSLAKNLKGHLLIAYGTMDNNVPPYNSLIVINELIKAGRDVDVLPLPNRNHGFGSEPYMVRKRWDYFVRYLMGTEPPKEYQIGLPRRPAT